MQKDGYATADKIKNTYCGLNVKKHTLMPLFESHNKELDKNLE